MKLSVGFRRAVATDVDFLLQLRKLTMTEHLNNAGFYFSDEDHIARIKEFFNDSFIITNHKESIGLIKLGVLADRIHIRQFQILPSFHGKGVGSFVLDVTKKKARERKLPVTLNVLLDNPAKSLYLRHGFYVEEQLKLEYKMRCDNE
ncbi:GNAT family N-acetyltransferase [Pseudocolwellia sp. AS88]|uniref:GNAT family N-acetyltransferase n=1 Tax=Pseudocolwellia TaxID=2848177 RepID=UPI0026EB440D|nr:GNAT family N-acetyltransferase [Pseudocolwellia sp. AS88]MDO7086373.1 GNAT family N-acetyltransferase [Pseudocolwellia sp. AS88]